ncbi:MAG TPA: phosphatase PAP2 family protein [Acidimicrobiales bacterium]|nr:phosphatase PAP2 family protein [Acidimicrobiales bacterium]
MVVFYGLYTVVRDLNDGDAVPPALHHAHQIIGLERALHVFDEAWVQHLVVHDRPFMRFWDGYYGTVHFVAVIVVLVGLFSRNPGHYRRWRNTLAATTLIGLLGFWRYPLLPPRLLASSYGFTDTLATIGGLWDFRSGAVDAVSNQYAAMPSLHTAWSLWCALALWSCVGRRRLRPLLLIYPAATVFCVVVTANHYFADAVAGAAVVGLGYLLSVLGEHLANRWRLHRAARAVLAGAPSRQSA